MKYYTNWIQAKSIDAQRVFKESSQKYRNNFQKDRDRILYSKSFRRLSGKTQIFLTGQNDHLRTRLTHSLEVNQMFHLHQYQPYTGRCLCYYQQSLQNIDHILIQSLSFF
jgi:hypothetical protein